jgi:hypothetical protein
VCDISSKTYAGIYGRGLKQMNGQHPPIPGRNGPKIAARRIASLRHILPMLDRM